ncbi:MAG TPA: extracellular solute-binding protein, partial [Planctomycetota bacterium]|nr:extracellular solute-binding protein [Planctomycetota bacterium]
MKRGLLAAAFAASLVAVLVFAGVLLQGRRAADAEPLLVYCGAGLRVPVEAAARAFEKATGRRVELQYGGSQTLLANAQASGRGDLYVPADDLFVARARERKLLAEVFALARMAPVLAVRKTNPKGIRSVDDLLRPDVKLSLPNPDAAAAGTLFREALRKTARWEAVEKATAVFKPTVNAVGNDLRLGAVDAGILWDALL